MKRIHGITVLTISLLLPENRHANFLDAYGAGWNVGTAGAGSAVMQDTAAAYFNPAGLAHPGRFSEFHNRSQASAPKEQSPPFRNQQSNGRIKLLVPKDENLSESTASMTTATQGTRRDGYSQFSLSYLQSIPDLAINLDSQNPLAVQQKNKAENLNYDGYMQLGIALDMRSLVDIPYDIPIVLGIFLGLSATGTLSAVPAYSETAFNFQRAGNNINLMQAVVAISVQPWKNRLSLGFSPGASSVISGNAQVSNITLNSSQPTHVNAVADLKSELAPVLATNYRQPLPFGDLFLSFTYRFPIKQKADITLTTELPLGIKQDQKLNSELIAYPDTMKFGIAYAWKGFVFMTDLEFQRWSTLQIDTALVSKFQPLNFYDILIVRAAVESSLAHVPYVGKAGVMARLGFAFVPAYTPDQSGTSNYLDNSKYIIAFGLRKLFGKNTWILHATELNLSFQWQYWQPRDTAKSNSFILADGSVMPNYRYGGNIFVISAGVTWHFDNF